MRCEQVAESLCEAAGGSTKLDESARRHVDACLRCQAELVQYRKLLRSLRAMRMQILEPAPGLLPEILAAVEAAGERRALRELVAGHRVAYYSGLAAATAAAAGGAIVIASRSKRRLRLAS